MTSFPNLAGYARVAARLMSAPKRDNVVEMAAYRPSPSIPAIGYGVAAEHVLTSPAFKASMTFAA